jgi:SAM-dependent methyltransferase
MQCRICGNTDQSPTYIAKEMMLGLRDEHCYFECSQCGCLQIAEIPADLASYYPPATYYSYSDATSHANPLKKTLIKQRDQYAVTGNSLLGQALQAVSPNAKLASLRPLNLKYEMRILDIGCGAGHLLHSLRDLGFQHLLGLDPFNQTDLAYANGLRIEKRDIFSETGLWDVIMFHHSLEHVPDQQAHLKQAFNLLKPNGQLLIRVPTVSSYAWQHYGVNWVQLDAPRHLYLHSIQSMQHLAEQCGFKVEQYVYDSNAFQFWGSEQYQQDIPLRGANSYADNPSDSPFSEQDLKQFAQRSKQLNLDKQGDQVAFYLRKVA